jgi:elongation factor Tu
MDDIEAEITFIPTEKGGRHSPAFQNYRPQFYIDGLNYAALYHFIGVEQVNPGETVNATIKLLAADLLEPLVKQGKTFEMREGAKIVAYGKITKVLNLAASAEECRRTNSNDK